MRDRHTVHGFIPPFIFRHLAKSGKKGVSAWAEAQLHVGGYIRAERASASPKSTISGFVGAASPPQGGSLSQMVGGIPPRKFRLVHDARNLPQLPGALIRKEATGPVNDPHVDEAYEFMGDTFDFFHELFGRDSLDDAGMRLVASVRAAERGHDGRPVPVSGAFWKGEQAIFGEGDGRIFQRLTRSLDVVAHELVHGIQCLLPKENRLTPYGQSGALQEHFCDVFGALVRQWKNHKVGTPERGDERWLLGREVLMPSRTRRAIRDMKNPGTAFEDDEMGPDNQVKHVDDLYVGHDDQGGIHINSGIPNRAFVLAAEAIGGDPWAVPGRIWYRALHQLRGHSRFSDCARQTILEAQTFDRATVAKVRNAWKEVGVTVPKRGS